MSGSDVYRTRRRWWNHSAIHVFYAVLVLGDVAFAARAGWLWTKGGGWFFLVAGLFDAVCGVGVTGFWVIWICTRRLSDVR